MAGATLVNTVRAAVPYSPTSAENHRALLEERRDPYPMAAARTGDIPVAAAHWPTDERSLREYYLGCAPRNPRDAAVPRMAGGIPLVLRRG